MSNKVYLETQKNVDDFGRLFNSGAQADLPIPSGASLKEIVLDAEQTADLLTNDNLLMTVSGAFESEGIALKTSMIPEVLDEAYELDVVFNQKHFDSQGVMDTKMGYLPVSVPIGSFRAIQGLRIIAAPGDEGDGVIVSLIKLD